MSYSWSDLSIWLSPAIRLPKCTSHLLVLRTSYSLTVVDARSHCKTSHCVYLSISVAEWYPGLTLVEVCPVSDRTMMVVQAHIGLATSVLLADDIATVWSASVKSICKKCGPIFPAQLYILLPVLRGGLNLYLPYKNWLQDKAVTAISCITVSTFPSRTSSCSGSTPLCSTNFVPAQF